ncbi:cell division protein ZapA [Desulfovermiculus halophilus]|jgi:cell division protein ZapA|uniref:cell division protein ZapA n=1 Tax=Desulfovermiculus halophilus TaxID=339722 RepID=UPI00048557DA|nr:cell division protein ZapA [Desulfovermiculus halophilus]
MPSYNVRILGQEVSFRTNAEEDRIRHAEQLIQERFQGLDTYGSRVSNEKLLILVALSLADDYIQTQQRLEVLEDKVRQLLERMDQEDTSGD